MCKRATGGFCFFHTERRDGASKPCSGIPQDCQGKHSVSSYFAKKQALHKHHFHEANPAQVVLMHHHDASSTAQQHWPRRFNQAAVLAVAAETSRVAHSPQHPVAMEEQHPASVSSMQLVEAAPAHVRATDGAVVPTHTHHTNDRIACCACEHYTQSQHCRAGRCCESCEGFCWDPSERQKYAPVHGIPCIGIDHDCEGNDHYEPPQTMVQKAKSWHPSKRDELDVWNGAAAALTPPIKH